MTDGPAVAPAIVSVPIPAEPATAVPSADLDETAAGRPRQIWANLGNPFAVGLTLTLGGLVAIALGVAFMNLSTIVMYIGLGLFVALALNPAVNMLGRRGMSRPLSIVLIYGLFAIIVGLGMWFIVPRLFNDLSTFVSSIPTLITNFEASDTYAWIESTFGDQVSAMLDQVETFFTNPANLAAIAGGALKVGVGIATAISGGIIVIVLSLYFLASLPAMKESFTQFAPARSRGTARSMINEITDSIGGYLVGMVILASCNAVVAFLLHLVLQLPHPGLMAFAAFCITLIPLIGSVCYWIFATVIALFTNPVAALIFAIAYLIYMQLEAYVLTPRVMNKAVSVPGALVVIGAMVGGTLMGLLGALVAIPITASILLIIKRVFIPKQDAKV
ncbi:AI-2E family transporter [Microbacterium sp. HJ5]